MDERWPRATERSQRRSHEDRQPEIAARLVFDGGKFCLDPNVALSPSNPWMPVMIFKVSSFGQIGFVLCWGILVGLGMYRMQKFDYTPSINGNAPSLYPADVDPALNRHGESLLVFIHPNCPCSRATITELERLVARSGDRLMTSVIFWHPEGVSPNWHESSMWAAAKSIPRVRVIDDLGCVLSRRFGAKTSGQTFLYNSAGRLQFSGGITQARGHAGDNPGTDAILALIAYNPLGKSTANCSEVFGCPLSETRLFAITGESK